MNPISRQQITPALEAGTLGGQRRLRLLLQSAAIAALAVGFASLPVMIGDHGQIMATDAFADSEGGDSEGGDDHDGDDHDGDDHDGDDGQEGSDDHDGNDDEDGNEADDEDGDEDGDEADDEDGDEADDEDGDEDGDDDDGEPVVIPPPAP